MGIQFPPIAFLCLLYFTHVATLHTSLHTRHRCENEAHRREIGQAQQAWELGAQLFARQSGRNVSRNAEQIGEQLFLSPTFNALL